MSFSVVIPTLNEVENVPNFIQLFGKENVELIISDGGSVDGTPELAQKLGANVVISKMGRGIQCNAGARATSGDILLFLHADTILPLDVFKKLEKFFSDPNRMVGKFSIRFNPSHWLLDLITFFSRLDTVFTSFGDQCIVIRRIFFNYIGGFPDWPLFEDVRFLQKARRITKVYSLKDEVITSSRRFLANGVIRQLIWNAWLLLLFLSGRSQDRLANMYRRKLS